MATTLDSERTYRSTLLSQAMSLRTLADADERRAEWVERCGGTADDAQWHRDRAAGRRTRARELVRRYDAECRAISD